MESRVIFHTAQGSILWIDTLDQSRVLKIRRLAAVLEILFFCRPSVVIWKQIVEMELRRLVLK
jgi:hypothetical protein